MATLATEADLVARIGSLTADQSARAPALLDDASGMVRSYTRQQFTAATQTQTLRSQGGLLRLPQRPVTAVAQVVAIGYNGTPDVTLVDWWWDGTDLIKLGSGNMVINLPERWFDDESGWPSTFRVTYTSGYEQTPDDVVRIVCSMVLRCLTAPTLVGGVTSESIGPYSYRLESAGVGTAVSMSADERKDLDRYRPKAGTITTRTY
ncbi:hypothetical protein [Acrocarpospora sp. B8E8]|uniref:hypothetical protein n=1 Tax=Acrocarpospora sp. B8E8 TaxID=3153572 RepID=UPI00325D6C3E